jgi:hypothetical protein
MYEHTIMFIRPQENEDGCYAGELSGMSGITLEYAFLL